MNSPAATQDSPCRPHGSRCTCNAHAHGICGIPGSEKRSLVPVSQAPTPPDFTSPTPTPQHHQSRAQLGKMAILTCLGFQSALNAKPRRSCYHFLGTPAQSVLRAPCPNSCSQAKPQRPVSLAHWVAKRSLGIEVKKKMHSISFFFFF